WRDPWRDYMGSLLSTKKSAIEIVDSCAVLCLCRSLPVRSLPLRSLRNLRVLCGYKLLTAKIAANSRKGRKGISSASLPICDFREGTAYGRAVRAKAKAPAARLKVVPSRRCSNCRCCLRYSVGLMVSSPFPAALDCGNTEL